ncbi:response regulator [Pseudomonas sp. SDI]|uniref:response regulator n=1 Tax=Pseudomonas sp. SDI TaxID=2170734 RepID=UPI000DE64906|nr:response regulator [Pseudomonas sp. SDI]PWB31384.1 response regulator [Pseudomonas sp. SDI]
MKTILVVDDEYLITEILGFSLEDAGYRVQKAGDGKKALEILRAEPIDLLITDYMMPAMNGEELAQAVRANPALSNLPIILMSGAQANIGRMAPELFASVLDKPFDTDKLIAQVRELILPSEAS